MRCLRLLFMVAALLAFSAATASAADQQPLFPLVSGLQKDATAQVTIELNVGGEMLIQEEKQLQKMPLSVAAKLQYEERLLAWSPDGADPVRCLRYYNAASATIQVDKSEIQRRLPAKQRLLLAEIRDGHAAINGLDRPLTREQLDLVNVVGNTLALEWLLPGRELAEGDHWNQKASTIGALLGMDHVAVCEVSSVVTGEVNNHVQIRMAGTVHGTIDGAPTELELRAAYLFHQRQKRITKFNLAIQEHRTPGEVVPGLDIVAQVKLAIVPLDNKPRHTGDLLADRAQDATQPLQRELLYDGRQRGFRFRYDAAWYVTAEQTDLLSLRRLDRGDLIAQCNITTLPARSAGRQTSLEQFEREVRQSLGEHLDDVTAATHWTTAQGHDCLGIVANGKVEGLPIQWRYYLIADDDLPRVSIAFTVEQSSLQHFADADRQIIDSLELLDGQAASTAAKQNGKASR